MTAHEHLHGQRLGRSAVAWADGTLQVSSGGFRYSDRTDAVDIVGHGMAGSRRFRNVADNGWVAFVVDAQRLIGFGVNATDAAVRPGSIDARNVG